MEYIQENQYWKLPNKILLNNNDRAIYSLLVLIIDKKQFKICKKSEENFARDYGQNSKFYSRGFNELKDEKFINIKTTRQKGSKKLNNEYSLNYKEYEDYTSIHKKIIDLLVIDKKILEQNKEQKISSFDYKALVFYIQLKRWINKDTFKATNLLKVEIDEFQPCARNTTIKYLKILEDLDLIKLKCTDINLYTLTMIKEIELKKEDEYNKNNNIKFKKLEEEWINGG